MIKIHRDLIQGSEQWFAARCSLLTASEMKNIITAKTLKYSSSEKEKTHLYELVAQRVTKYVEPTYISDDMLKGMEAEIYARTLYSEKYEPVEEVGFITNDKFGFTLGYSPDGKIIDKNAGIECKGRRQKYQIQVILENTVPDDFIIQLQTGLLVSEWEWLDFITYHGGMFMKTIRVYPDLRIQAAILDAATEFHIRMNKLLADYKNIIEDAEGNRLIMTERKTELEIVV